MGSGPPRRRAQEPALLERPGGLAQRRRIPRHLRPLRRRTRLPRWRTPCHRRLDPFLATVFVWVNCDIKGTKPADLAARKALLDPRVRQALGMAIDRSLVAEKVLRAGEAPALHFTPPGTGGFQPTARWKQDANEARRLLAEAGYPGGKGLPKFDYLYNTSEGSQMVAQAYQEMWRRSAMRKGEFHLCRGAWVGDYNDPNTFLEMLITGNELNQSNWSDAEYDRLLGLAAKETDMTQRFGYRRLQQEQVPHPPRGTRLVSHPAQPAPFHRRPARSRERGLNGTSPHLP
ncbi:MAG: hypothetical protein CAK86_01530 [Opitutia bacterium AMD-G1]|nr:MAG: hypothetical protein CAK86_01530 [Opitutae bacterium AMD-G1]